MAKWFFEPGHTSAEFAARHMMVTYIRGHFKNVHGVLVYDPANPQASSVEVTIDSAGLWTGEADRDVHLRSADFLDIEHHPEILFKSDRVELLGANDAAMTGMLTMQKVVTIPRSAGIPCNSTASAFCASFHTTTRSGTS